MVALSPSLELYKKAIDKHLEELVPEQKRSRYATLIDAARYSLFAGGKRFRPILTLVTTEMLGTSVNKALGAACAIEMIHTYSLIHDDLPCMDNDDLRRGKPTLHKAFSEATAVLAGDFLLTEAFGVIGDAHYLPAEIRSELVTVLATRAGSTGMIGGQMMDLEAEGKSISIDHLIDLHTCKTGDLIAAAIESGAIIAGVSKREKELLGDFGETIGLAFQIMDDVLDATSTDEILGKTAGSDQANNKSTFVSFYGVDVAKIKALELLKGALETLAKLPYDTTELFTLAEQLVRRDH